MSASGLDGVGDKMKIAMLINLIWDDGHEIFYNFEFAQAADKDDFQKVMDKFEGFCAPKKNLTVERFNFFNIVQNETEPFE